MSMRYWLRCRSCQAEADPGPSFAGCARCGGALEVTYDYQAVNPAALLAAPRPFDLLPVQRAEDLVTLGEGNTPLVPSLRLGPSLDLRQCYFKNETTNPTWGHKDRTQSIMLSKAREFGYGRVTVASTGNHGASAAAYSARAGLEACAVFCPPETSPTLLHLIASYGGTAFVADWEIRHRFVEFMVTELGWYPATSLRGGPASNPYGIEGYKAIAYEIVRELGRAPDQVFMACANGGSLYGVYKGFKELRGLGLIDRLPRMMACQPAGANVLERSVTAGLRQCVVLDNPSSIAISVREPSSGEYALEAIYESEGRALSVTDEQILDAIELMGREGLCVEAASAVVAAGIRQARERGWIGDEETVVAVVTSSGVKWPETLEIVGKAGVPLEPDLGALQVALASLDLGERQAR